MFEANNKKQGLVRIFSAFTNTAKGLSWMIKNEAAFRQELLLCLLLVPVSFAINISIYEHAALLISLLFVLFTEILNTAIEAVVDRIGFEYHELSGLAKDLASAAVFLSMVIATIVWAAVLLS